MSSKSSPTTTTGVEPVTASRTVAMTGDIVREIIGHLHNKKDVLTACMRVSPLFNELASIPLYSDIRLSDGTMQQGRHPFVISEERSNNKIATKNELLRLVRTVTIVEHRCTNCFSLFDSSTASSPLQISARTLRVHLNLWWNDLSISMGLPQAFDSVSKLGEAESCSIIRNFTGPNLVLFGANMQRALLKTHSIPASVKNLTIVVRQDTLRDPSFEPYSVDLSLERLDFLFYNTSHLAIPKIGGGHVSTPYSYIDKSRLANLVHVILHAEAAAQIRIIDMDKSSQKTFNEKLSELNQRHRTRLADKDIVFLTQDEYRDQKDWKGVLTPAEVKMWNPGKRDSKETAAEWTALDT